MTGRVEMLGGVLVGRAVTAADMPASPADALAMRTKMFDQLATGRTGGKRHASRERFRAASRVTGWQLSGLERYGLWRALRS